MSDLFKALLRKGRQTSPHIAAGSLMKALLSVEAYGSSIEQPESFSRHAFRTQHDPVDDICKSLC